MSFNETSLRFLHKWLNENKISQIRKGMVEDLAILLDEVMAQQELSKVSAKMTAKHEKVTGEQNEQKNP